MFSRILSLSKNLFKKNDLDSQRQHAPIASTSALQFWGEACAETSSMVTTRKQGQSLHDGEVKPEVKSNGIGNEARKRKLGGGAGSPEAGKRRRVEIEEIDVEVDEEAIHQGDRVSITGSQNGILTEEIFATRRTEDPSVVKEAKDAGVTDIVGTSLASQAEDSTTQSEETQKTGTRSRSTTKVENLDVDTPPQLDADSDLVSSKRQHIRFGVDEPEELPINDHAPSYRDQGQILPPNEDSDDEGAPETIENISELKKVQVKSLKAAQAHDTVKTQIKEKRRKQDARLKGQARAKKKNRPALVEGISDSYDDEEPRNSIAAAFKSEYDLPALLPESILNSVPQKRKLDTQSEAPKVSHRPGKHLKLSSKPPKDILVGKTTVRISKSDKNVLPLSLPPKNSSKSSRNIRETWLQSLRGVEGGAKRRKTTKFVRK